jgi:hypothetical protein
VQHLLLLRQQQPTGVWLMTGTTSLLKILWCAGDGGGIRTTSAGYVLVWRQWVVKCA